MEDGESKSFKTISGNERNREVTVKDSEFFENGTYFNYIHQYNRTINNYIFKKKERLSCSYKITLYRKQ